MVAEVTSTEVTASPEQSVVEKVWRRAEETRSGRMKGRRWESIVRGRIDGGLLEVENDEKTGY